MRYVAVLSLLAIACYTETPSDLGPVAFDGELPAGVDADQVTQEFLESGAMFGVVVDPTTGQTTTLQNLDRTTTSSAFSQVSGATCLDCGGVNSTCTGPAGVGRQIQVELQRNNGAGAVDVSYVGNTNWTPTGQNCGGIACPNPNIDATGGPVPVTIDLFGALSTCSAFTVYFNTEDGAASPTILAYYDFDGNLVDQAGNAPNLQLAGSAALTTGGQGVTGGGSDESIELGTVNNGAFAFTATGTHFDQAVTNQAMAVSFWQFRNFNGQTSSFWINSPVAGGTNRGFQMHVPWDDGIVYFDQSGCCAGSQRLTVPAQVPTVVPTGVWQHVVAQRDAAGNREIWIDGVLEASAGGAEALDTLNGRLVVGASDAGGISFGGRIDEFSVYASALSPGQIGLLANGASPFDL